MNRLAFPALLLSLPLFLTGGCESRPGAGKSGSPDSSSFPSVAAQQGLSFQHDASEGAFYIIEEMGPGVAFFDADGDGDVDVYCVQGGRPPGTERGEIKPNALYLNDGKGTFRLAADSGAEDTHYGMGAAAADIDNDGDIDLYVTNVGRDTLLVNDGNGRFEDRTELAGLGADQYSATAAFADYDSDGLLDLYVTVYVPWTPEIEQTCLDPFNKQDYCNPTVYAPGQDRLYRNLGDGKFEDVTLAAGIGGSTGYGLGVVGGDFDGDGHIDFFVANDHQPNFLWRNRGDGTFEEVGTKLGCSYNADGRPEASMGIVCDDLDVDGDLDLFITHFYRETNTLYKWDGGEFSDETTPTGLSSHGVMDTGFGTGLLDIDHDGTAEIFIANGAVLRSQKPIRPGHPYVEPNALLHLGEDGRFQDWSSKLGLSNDRAEMSRGVALADIDRDGDLDVLVANNRGPLELLRNDTPSQGSWLIVELEGKTVNRQGLGAIVTVDRPGAKPLRRHLCPQASYLSSHEPIVHFGLGQGSDPVTVSVQWPGRREREIWEGVARNTRPRLVEGTGTKTEAIANSTTEKTAPPPRLARESVDHPKDEEWNRLVIQQLQRGQLVVAQDQVANWLATTADDVGKFHYAYTRGIVAQGTIYRVTNDEAAAETLYLETLKTHPDENASVALLHSELGGMKLKRGDAAGARPHLETALRIFTDHLGVDATPTTAARNRLGETLIALGKRNEILPLLTSQFDLWYADGERTEAFIRLARQIGMQARTENKTAQSARYRSLAVEGLTGPVRETELVATVWHELGDDYNKLRDYNRAIKAYQEALRIRQRVLGERSLDTAVSLSQLANVELKNGDLKSGETHVRDALAYFMEELGDENLHTVTAMRTLAHAAVLRKSYAEAQQLYERVLVQYRKSLGDANPATVMVRDNLRKLRKLTRTP